MVPALCLISRYSPCLTHPRPIPFLPCPCPCPPRAHGSPRPPGPRRQASEGVGIVLDVEPDAHHPVVVSLVPGKAAEACGRIAVGDRLLAVAGQPTLHLTFNDVRDLIVGPVGTPVRLDFQGPEGDYHVDLVRGAVRPDDLTAATPPPQQLTARPQPATRSTVCAAGASAVAACMRCGTHHVLPESCGRRALSLRAGIVVSPRRQRGGAVTDRVRATGVARHCTAST